MGDVVSIEKVLDRVGNGYGLKKTFFRYQHYVYQLNTACKNLYGFDVKGLDDAERDYYNYLMGIFQGLFTAGVISSLEYALCMRELEDLHFV